MKKNNPAQTKAKLSKKAELQDTKKTSTSDSLVSKMTLKKINDDLEAELKRQAKELAFQNKEKEKRADELISVNKELSQSKKKVEEILNSITDGLLVFDHNWCFTYINEQGAKIVGMPKEEFTGKCIWDLFPDAKNSKFYKYYHLAVETKQTQSFEEYYAEPVNVWFSCTCFPSPEGLSVYFKDITENKQAQFEIRERNKELNCLYELSKLLENPKNQLSDIFKQLVGIMKNAWQFTDITCARIIFENNEFSTDNFKKTKWGQSAKIMVQGKESGTIEVYYLQKKPEEYEGPFLKEERNLINALAERLGKTIDRERVTNALKESEENLKVAQQLSKTGSWNLDIITDRIIWSNELMNINGHDKNLPVPAFANMSSYYTPESWALLTAKVNNTFQTGQPFELETEMIRPNGTKVICISKGNAVRNSEGKIVSLNGTVQDITERKEADNIIREKITELERFQNLTVDRELGMIALKKEINELRKNKGEAIKYIINE